MCYVNVFKYVLEALTRTGEALSAHDAMWRAKLPLVPEDDGIAETVSIDGVVLRGIVRVGAAGVGLRSIGAGLCTGRRDRVARHL